MKKIIALIIMVILLTTAVTPGIVRASDLDIDADGGQQAYGEIESETGDFIYYHPEVTIPKKTPGTGSLPEKYDLREEGRVTPVKNQMPYSFCWTFATMSSLESNLITKGIADDQIDLSEAHLAYFGLHGKSESTLSMYAGRDTCMSAGQTANYYCAAAGLARGYGAVNESDMPYSVFKDSTIPPEEYMTEAMRTKSVYELADAAFVSADTTVDQYDEKAVNAVKELIMKNGVVATKMYFPDKIGWLDAFGSTKPKEWIAYYYPEEMADHAISIVGWDDTFNDFPGNIKPKGPGAWIVKDSYGTDIHDQGYLYISYYSPSLSQFISFTGQKNSGREIYQYDGTGVGDWMIKQEEKISGANCFTARGDVLLDQVMAFTPEADCTVNVKIYITKNGTAPTSGVKALDETYKQRYAGYSRVDLGKTVAVPKGAKFSVIVTVKTSSGQYFVPFELQDVEDKFNLPAVTRSGLSYMQTGGEWVDINRTSRMTDDGYLYRPYNALIKVYGKKAGKTAQTIKVETKRTMKKGKSIKLNAKRTKGKGKLVYQTSNSKIATVSQSGVVKAKKAGTVKITVYCLPTGSYKSAKKIVTVKIG